MRTREEGGGKGKAEEDKQKERGRSGRRGKKKDRFYEQCQVNKNIVQKPWIQRRNLSTLNPAHTCCPLNTCCLTVSG